MGKLFIVGTVVVAATVLAIGRASGDDASSADPSAPDASTREVGRRDAAASGDAPSPTPSADTGLDAGTTAEDAGSDGAASASDDDDLCIGPSYVEVTTQAEVVRTLEGCTAAGPSFQDGFECTALDDGETSVHADFQAPGVDQLCIEADVEWLAGTMRRGILAQALGGATGGFTYEGIAVNAEVDGSRRYGTATYRSTLASASASAKLRVTTALSRRPGPLYSLSARLRELDGTVLVEAGFVGTTYARVGEPPATVFGAQLGLVNDWHGPSAGGGTAAAHVRFTNVHVRKHL